MIEFIKTYNKEDVLQILETDSTNELPFVALPINLTSLRDHRLDLYKKLTNHNNVWTERPKWIEALNVAQKEIADSSYDSVKLNFPVTFCNLPNFTNADLSYSKLFTLVQVEGRINNKSDQGFKEILREYCCKTCKKKITLSAEPEHKFTFDEPSKCIARDCKGKMFNTEDSEIGENKELQYMQYQEIKITVNDRPDRDQLTVELHRELAGKCEIGEMVKIVGTFELRSDRNMIENAEAVLRAVDIQPLKRKLKSKNNQSDLDLFFVTESWNSTLTKFNGNELEARDEIVTSVAPELKGLAVVKLGLLLVLCSGGSSSLSEKSASEQKREICHMLLAGDPGMGKSQLLKAASLISDNSVVTVGYSTTNAGLTAHVYQEDGNTFIEGGALVKANNGICCIDEINLMKSEHRASIHEVMEAQKMTIAKAGKLVDIATKVSILGGMNTKNITRPIEGGNFALEGSLLSRFDFIFAFGQPEDNEFDDEIIDHILRGCSEKAPLPKWSLDRIKKHVLIAKEIKPEMTPSAKQILTNYFKFCWNQENIEISRKTMRLFDSLDRLTKCHAKLMLRQKVEIIDALTVVMLMENSWSFGSLLQLELIAKSTTPLGPSKEVILQILERLQLEDLLDEIVSQPKQRNSQKPQNFSIDNIDAIFEDFSEPEEENDQKSQPNSSSIKIDDGSEDIFAFLEAQATSTQHVEVESDSKTENINTEPKASLKIDENVDPLKSNLMQLLASFSNPIPSSSHQMNKPKEFPSTILKEQKWKQLLLHQKS